MSVEAHFSEWHALPFSGEISSMEKPAYCANINLGTSGASSFDWSSPKKTPG